MRICINNFFHVSECFIHVSIVLKRGLEWRGTPLTNIYMHEKYNFKYFNLKIQYISQIYFNFKFQINCPSVLPSVLLLSTLIFVQFPINLSMRYRVNRLLGDITWMHPDSSKIYELSYKLWIVNLKGGNSFKYNT